jgi:hypothetical protein
VCFAIRKTTSELECAILTTLYLVNAKNNDSWYARKGDLQHAFPLDVLMITSPKLCFIANGNNPTGVSLALGETIHFGNLVFTADRFGHLSLSSDERNSGTIFIGIMHNGSSSSHTTLEDSSVEGSAALGAGGISESLGP